MSEAASPRRFVAEVPAEVELVTETPDEMVHVFVQLTDPSAIEVYSANLQSARRAALAIDGEGQDLEPSDIAPSQFREMRAQAAEKAKAQLAVIARAQEPVEAMLQRPEIGARILYRTRRAINGFAVSLPGNRLEAVRNMPGVKAVLTLPVHTINNSTSVPFLNVPAGLWDPATGPSVNGLTGDGISIAVIDTGIDYQHATFGGTGLLADYQANNRTVISESGAAAFPTAKVVGGYDFAGDAYAFPNAPTPDPDPMDCNGHGTHVAGTAAGFGVTTAGATFAGPYDGSTAFGALRIGPGVAPKAQLYALRVFGCGGSTVLTTQAIDWAMDPNGDEDLSDHLDVINMSLGSSTGSPFDATAVASNNAAEAGIIVVASAGNSGETYYTTGSPGLAERVLSVAASGDFTPIVRSSLNSGTDHIGGVASFGPPLTTSGTPPGTLSVVLANDGVGTTSDGCCASPSFSCGTNSWTGAPGAYSGKIVIIDRGTCGFAQKVLNAQNNGAAGVIIANNSGGTAVFSMGGGGAAIDPFITIQSAMVSQNDGAAIKAAIPGVTATLSSQNRGDLIASFSAFGPRRGSGAKPDIAAPGASITSAQTGITCTSGGCITVESGGDGVLPGNQALTIGGTSMAAPHMAGFMALMRQLHPTWSERDLRAMAVNVANTDVYTGLDSTGARHSTSRVGGGRVHSANLAAGVAAAGNNSLGTGVLLSDPGEHVLEVLGSRTATRSVSVRNPQAYGVKYDVSYVAVNDAPGVNIIFPFGRRVSVLPNRTATFRFAVSAPSADAMWHKRDDAIAASQGSAARQWITEESGYLLFTPLTGGPVLRVPVQGVVRPASNMKAATRSLHPIALSGIDVETTGGGAFDDVSVVSALEWQATSPNVNLETGDPAYEKALDHADLRHVGVASDVPQGGNNVYFGIATWGNWSTPREVQLRVWVDANRDGTADWVALGWPNGLGGTTASPTDTAVSAVCNVTLASCGVGYAYLNGYSPTSVNTNLFNSSVMVIPVPRNPSTPSGLTAITGAFNYYVEGYSRDWGTVEYLPATGWLTYDPTAPGVNFNAADGGFQGSPLFGDLNGDAIDYAFNPANFAANGSLGALLLHHHNRLPSRAEALPLTHWVSVSDVNVSEGGAGVTAATFTLSLNAPATKDVQVRYSTADGTAGSTDYFPRTSQAVIRTGQTSVNVMIGVRGDALCEAGETFFLNVNSVAGAAISDGQGQATIANDDTCN